MLSCSHFVKKTFIHLTHSALMPIFRQEYVHFQKTQRSDVIFQYFMKNPLLLYPYLVKKRQFCQNYAMWLPKKVSRMLIFPFCIKKIAALMPKKPPFSKNHNALIPIFCQKNVSSLKNTPISCDFFHVFHKNPLLSWHIWLKKGQFCQNYTIYYGQQK